MDYFKRRNVLRKELEDYWTNSLSKKFSGDKNNTGESWPIISPEVAALK